MLIDDVLNSGPIKTLAGEAFPKLREDLLQATRFNLSEPFAHAVDDIRRRNPEAAWKARNLIRPPYRNTWIETAAAFRPWFHRIDMTQWTTGVPRVIPQRVGCLFHVTPNAPHDVFCMTLFWSPSGDYRDHGPMMGVLQCMADFSEQREFKAAKRKFLPNHPDSESLWDLWPIPCLYLGRDVMKRIWPEFSYPRQPTPDEVARSQEVITSAWSDWEGEAGYWPLTLLMMHSRNVAYVETPSVSKLDLKRAKQQGVSADRVLFRTCKLKMDRIVRRHGPGGEAAAMRQHWVMGHFKVRKTGTFWWSPYTRGDLRRGMVVKEYEVG